MIVYSVMFSFYSKLLVIYCDVLWYKIICKYSYTYIGLEALDQHLTLLVRHSCLTGQVLENEGMTKQG